MRAKILFLSLVATMYATVSFAQEDKNVFNHLAVGVGVGTPGISVELAAPLTDYVAVRAGVNIMPQIKYATDIEIDDNKRRELRSLLDENHQTMDYFGIPEPNVPEDVDVEGKLKNTTGHILVDLYPIRKADWHLTLGAYFGGEDVVNAYTTNDGQLSGISAYNNALNDKTFQIPSGPVFMGNDYKIGARLGDYFLEPDSHGHIDAAIRVNKFRPYVGLGWGRAVPRHHSVGFSIDFGVQFWNSPKVYCQDVLLAESDVSGEDGGIIKTISKISVYPVLSFKLNCKLF